MASLRFGQSLCSLRQTSTALTSNFRKNASEMLYYAMNRPSPGRRDNTRTPGENQGSA
jgi:hypothetical protein